MAPLIRLQPETFTRLVEEAGRHHATVDDTVERILREDLPASPDATSRLATLRRIERLQARMKPGREQSSLSERDVGSSDGASSERSPAITRWRDALLVCFILPS